MSKRQSAAAVEERPADDTFTTGSITIAPTPAKALEPNTEREPNPAPDERVLRNGKLRKQAGQRHVDAIRRQVKKGGKRS